MKPNLKIDVPENHAVDILANEIVNLENKIESIHYCMADGDPDGRLQEELGKVQVKLADCKNGLKWIYAQIM